MGAGRREGDGRAAPVKPEISLEDFQRADIRVGTIRAMEDVPGSKKLVRLVVDFGDRTRTILAGMKGERPNPREIVGRQTLFLLNLPPRKMAGETSEGMLLDVGYADGIPPAIVVPERPVPDGSRLG
jgi:tRNA-binding protein